MDLFRRIGTQKKKFKVQFFISRLKFSAYRAGQIYIVIKRGDHKVKSEQKLQMTEDYKLNFNKEILEVEATLYFDQKQQLYQQKLGQISVVLLDEKKNKILLGVVAFDLATYANSGQQSIKQNKKLQNSPKKIQGRIQYTVFIKYIGQGSESSADKVSDFFFGKNKQEPNAKEQQNKKQKTKRNQSKSKKDKENGKKKEKTNIQSQQSQIQSNDNKKRKSKQKLTNKSSQQKPISQEKNKKKTDDDDKQLQSKNYVSTSNKTTNNNEKAYLTSDNQEQASKRVFYFDQPPTQLSVGQKTSIKDKKPSNIEQSQLKQQTAAQKPITLNNKTTSKAKQTKITTKDLNRNSSQDQQEGSQGEEDIETSEVQPVDTSHMFAKSEADSVNKAKTFSKSQETSLKDEPLSIKIKQSQQRLNDNSFAVIGGMKSQKVEALKGKYQDSSRKESIDKKYAQKGDKGTSVIKGRDVIEKDQKTTKQNQQNGTNTFGKSVQKQTLFEFYKPQSTQKKNYQDSRKKDQQQQEEQEQYFNFNTSYDKTSTPKNMDQSKNSKPYQQPQSKGLSRDKLSKVEQNFKKSIIEQLSSRPQKETVASYQAKSTQDKRLKGINAFDHSDEQPQTIPNQRIPQKTTQSPPLTQPDVQTLLYQNQSLKTKLSQSQQTIKQLQTQLSLSRQQVTQLSDQIQYYLSEIKEKEEELQAERNNSMKNKREANESDDSKGSERFQQEIKRIQKEKNELIVENSKLKEKYKRDFAKYEEILEERDSKSGEMAALLKADLQRMKEDNSILRDKLEKLTAENSSKSTENLKQKGLITSLQAELNEVKESLSQIKFKICNSLNEALATGEGTAIELLMELNKH